jgi:ABC-type branched-subunit amino acid transport system ATPase component
VLTVSDLDVAYGQALALHGVCLQVQAGEMIFIVGRNGAGKTTFLKTVSGLLKPQRGQISYLGSSINGLPAEKLAQKGIRFVAQDKKVFSELTVRSNIELAAHGAGLPMGPAVDRVLGLYPKMEKFLDVKAGGLSGGQREILLIGRALVSQPKLLLIDEPTEGLAAVVIKDIFDILSSMKAQNASIIVEQNLSVVSKLADRVYIMKEGTNVRELTRPDEIAAISGLEDQL